MVQANQVFGLKSGSRLDASLVVAEFHFHRAARQSFHHSSHLPAHKTTLKHIAQQGYFGEQFEIRHRILAKSQRR